MKSLSKFVSGARGKKSIEEIVCAEKEKVV
jgi:hypothetical protein